MNTGRSSLFFSLALVCGFVLEFGNSTNCGQLPRLKDDNVKLISQYKDAWKIVVGNDPEFDRCLNFQFFGKANKVPNLGTALFINYKEGFHIKYDVDVSEKEWRVKHLKDLAVPGMYFRKLWCDVTNQAFCLYTCDKKQEMIEDLKCMATNRKGVESINEALNNFKVDGLPLKEAYVTTWDDNDCSSVFSPVLPLEPLASPGSNPCPTE